MILYSEFKDKYNLTYQMQQPRQSMGGDSVVILKAVTEEL